VTRLSHAVLEAQRLIRSRDYESALRLLLKEVPQMSDFGPAHAVLIDCYLSLGLYQEAHTTFDEALQRLQKGADAADGLAFYARRLGKHELSRNLYKEAVEAKPDDAQYWYNLATSERSLGSLESAVLACSRSLSLQPSYLPALLMRSELMPATQAQNHVDELRERLTGARTAREQIFCAYALGKELHDLKVFDEAFSAFSRGATMRRKTLAYQVSMDETKLQRIAEVYCTAPESTRHERSAADRHIFIVGLPRSGTTLTERIIGALPGVRSNGETGNLANTLLQLAPAGAGDIFERCYRVAPELLAQRYDGIAGYGAGTDKVIEKLPLNYLYIGAIAAAFQYSPIIWVKRDPIDSCFAMYRTLFGQGYPFSYDFVDLARYFAAFNRLMHHWIKLLPGRIIEVDYEHLVSSPGSVGQDLALRCGLSWRNDAIDLRNNTSVSTTASAAQVRGNIYTSSVGLWSQYQKHLKPLVDELTSRDIYVQ
jgi:tetratricopeptide (TPR) repeat protein